MLASLALLLVAADPAAADLRFVASLAAAAFSAQPEVSVLTSDDLRRAMNLEADRQAQGCDEAASCLAEIAAAMDARLVVYGTVDVLEDQLLVQLNVFDAHSAQGLGRVTARATTTSELARVTEERAASLAASTRAQLPGLLRILILDVEVRGRQPIEPTPWLWIAGSLLGTGALALGGGVVADVVSVDLFNKTTNEPTLAASTAGERYDQSNGWATVASVGYIVGGIALVGGAVVGVLATVQE
ncbi:MAG: hypothetical protein Q8O67_08300 [Deltaproteobacteria bacterium]|nr:hypothetical protein [Deltaproteobacteria bacterium]